MTTCLKKMTRFLCHVSILFHFCMHADASTDTTSTISILEAATFAKLIYHENNAPTIPLGFSLLCESPSLFRRHHYYGEAYYRVSYEKGDDQPSTVTVVITHRGTEINMDNLYDDLLIGMKSVPTAFLTSSKPFTDYVRNRVFSTFPTIKQLKFVHVGHSLGAIHAELNHVYQRDIQHDPFVFTITFENPGSKDILKQLIKFSVLNKHSIQADHAITTINADINAINSLNDQLSPTVLQIRPGYHFFPILNVNLSPIDIRYFLTLFTFDQHSMDHLYQYLKKGGSAIRLGVFPVGLRQAYAYYKTYHPIDDHDHQRYWEAALKHYWDQHPHMHKDYAYQYDAYHDYMIAHHLA